jgi:hypothetical protein
VVEFVFQVLDFILVLLLLFLQLLDLIGQITLQLLLGLLSSL